MEKTILFEDAINELNDSVLNENLTVFMGAGVSKFVNPDYPVWSGVTQKLKNELKFCFSNNALRIAQKYENKFGHDKFRETVKSLFPETSPDQSFYSELLKTRPNYIITTNWDNMFQNSIISSLAMYDIIADDSELMNSKLYNKYLKIHGDFQHSKFVLTKKSYNLYSKDFPLIENFVKSILCTTTVLFIGYSLSDKDFQQILNWIHKAAPSLPKFYCALAEGHYKKSDTSKYNKNNIKTFIVPNITDIFKKLNNKNALINTKKPIKAFYELIKPLEKDKVILLSSIQKFLTNSGYQYPSENSTLLWLHVDAATGDYNKERRLIFKNFIDSLRLPTSQEDNEIISKIIIILIKANIMGIINEGLLDHTHNNITFLPIYNLLKKYDKSKFYKNFNYEVYYSDEQKIFNIYENADHFSSIEVIESAFELNKKIIQNDINSKNYRKLFISYYNQNILQQLFYTKKIVPCNDREDSIDLYKKYTNLPKKLQKEVIDIYDFVNGNTLKSLHIELQDDFRKLTNRVKNIKQGGIAFDNFKYNFANRHKNLNDFVLLNHILIDYDSNFIQIEQLFFKIAVVRKSISNNIILNRNEIYTAIKYFYWNNDYEKNLNSLFQDNEIKTITISQDDENWLINFVLPNCAEIYKRSNYGCIKPYFNNLLTILCYCDIKDENIQTVVRYLKHLFAFSICDVNLISLTIQFFTTKINNNSSIFNGISIIAFYKILIGKTLSNTISPTIAVTVTENNYLCHFLHLGMLNKETFSDLNFINKLLLKYNNANLEERIGFYTNQLCMIYAFCSGTCKHDLKKRLLKFKDYLLKLSPPYGRTKFNNPLSQSDFTRLELKYCFTLLQLKLIRFTNSFYVIALNWLGIELLSPGYSSNTHELVYLIKKLKTNNPKLKTLQQYCEKIIAKYEKRPRISSI